MILTDRSGLVLFLEGKDGKEFVAGTVWTMEAEPPEVHSQAEPGNDDGAVGFGRIETSESRSRALPCRCVGEMMRGWGEISTVIFSVQADGLVIIGL